MPADAFDQLAWELLDREPLLRGRIAITHCYRVVVHRLMVDRHTVRCTDLVHPAVPPPDRARLIIRHHEIPLEQLAHGLRLLGLASLAQQRIDGDLDWRESGIESQ